jgi:death-on-curing protein
VRYLTLAEALVVAEVVTGVEAGILAKGPRIYLLDSALHAPQAGFGDFDLHPDFIDKAAVLVVRITKNHPLIDGNKRLAWGCLTMFCALNGYVLLAASEDAVSTMLSVAAGETDERAMAAWITARISAPK